MMDHWATDPAEIGLLVKSLNRKVADLSAVIVENNYQIAVLRREIAVHERFRNRLAPSAKELVVCHDVLKDDLVALTAFIKDIGRLETKGEFVVDGALDLIRLASADLDKLWSVLVGPEEGG